jgi:unsaturated chondroitin disaccharide hydrolase
LIQFELESDLSLFEDSFSTAKKKVKGLIAKNPDFYPMYTQDGKWKHEGPAWTHWCDGFLPGLMWIFAKRHGATEEGDYWMEQAIRYSKPLEHRKYDRDVHDLGFIFLSTYYRWYNLTHDPELQQVLIDAGRTLAMRFKDKGQYLRSFVSDDSLFIDIMMNVGIIFYAARETDDKRLRDIAMRHCLTTRRFLVRGDGSTSHEGLFDLETGEFLKQTTHQGWRGDSCWARGLTWALYGFGTSFEYSRDPRMLETAERCADFYITKTPADGIPPWDYDAPADSRKLVDTSAAAIAAAGLFRLCRLLPDPVKGHFYFTTALRILRTLCQKYVGHEDAYEGILKGGVYHIHKGLGVNESVMWGEYFFVEALSLALRQIGKSNG